VGDLVALVAVQAKGHAAMTDADDRQPDPIPPADDDDPLYQVLLAVEVGPDGQVDPEVSAAAERTGRLLQRAYDALEQGRWYEQAPAHKLFGTIVDIAAHLVARTLQDRLYAARGLTPPPTAPTGEAETAGFPALVADVRGDLVHVLPQKPNATRNRLQFIWRDTFWRALATMEHTLGTAEDLEAVSDERFTALLREQVLSPTGLAPALRDALSAQAQELSELVLARYLDDEHQATMLNATARLLGLDTDEALAAPTSDARPRGSNRKIELPWTEESPFPMPNLQNHGTRNLATVLSGDAQWVADPARAQSRLAIVQGQPIGQIDFTPECEAGERALLDHLSPGAIKAMVATSRLIFERTNHMPLNQGVTLRVGEIARAMGYRVDRSRHIDPAILRRVAGYVHVLSRTRTWAADGPYDPKTQRWTSSGWVAPLIAIGAVHVAQLALDDSLPLPYEFDAMLGRNWAQALMDSDLLQLAPGFMELTEENAIRLGWYYLTEFRYRMTKREPGTTRKVPALCAEARIDPGLPKHRGRFLERLEKWHEMLADVGVTGPYQRAPSAAEVKNAPNRWTPAKLYAEAEYHVSPPPAILEAYSNARQKRLEEKPNGRPRRSPKVRG
jgi:hypothetical protein